MYPVYLITCHHPSYGTHAKGYVGCIVTPGRTLQQRWAEHSWRRKEHVFYLQKAIQKHGKEWFSVQQIDAGNTPEEAKELEKWWIQWLGTLVPMGHSGWRRIHPIGGGPAEEEAVNDGEHQQPRI